MSDNRQLATQWDEEYRSGEWSRLMADSEFAHYTLVAGYIKKGGDGVTLLDIGCGEGVILNYLKLLDGSSYTGMDLAAAALEQVSARWPEATTYCSSLEQFTPDGKWDVILFNEVLYYTGDPVKHMAKFEGSLLPGGRFIVSIYRMKNPLAWNNRCISRLRRYFRTARYNVDDAVEILSLDGSAAWQIFVVRPPHRDAVSK